MYQRRPDFLQAKEWFFSCFLRPCILGTFCRFIPCNLSRLSECGLSELPSSIHSDDETEHDAFFVQTCVEEVENSEYVAPLKPLLSMRVEDPLDEELDSDPG